MLWHFPPQKHISEQLSPDITHLDLFGWQPVLHPHLTNSRQLWDDFGRVRQTGFQTPSTIHVLKVTQLMGMTLDNEPRCLTDKWLEEYVGATRLVWGEGVQCPKNVTVFERHLFDIIERILLNNKDERDLRRRKKNMSTKSLHFSPSNSHFCFFDRKTNCTFLFSWCLRLARTYESSLGVHGFYCLIWHKKMMTLVVVSILFRIFIYFWDLNIVAKCCSALYVEKIGMPKWFRHIKSILRGNFTIFSNCHIAWRVLKCLLTRWSHYNCIPLYHVKGLILHYPFTLRTQPYPFLSSWYNQVWLFSITYDLAIKQTDGINFGWVHSKENTL